MLVKDISLALEELAPLQYQEPYDNAGLIIGNLSNEVHGVLITIDITEDIIDESITLGCNMIVSHHPLIFSGIKKITGNSYIERCIEKAIKNGINIYSAHTNADSAWEGVNRKICEKLNLINCRTLSPAKGVLKKLVTFVPQTHIEQVREAIFNAGAGHIGNYENCSFNIEGEGTFKGNENTHPFVGKPEKLHVEKEIRLETIFPSHLQRAVIDAMLSSHPYEEIAYDIYSLENENKQLGIGMVGELKEATNEKSFLQELKKVFNIKVIRHTQLLGGKIKKVAVCGGSGSSLLRDAMKCRADIFISSDFKYHQFFDAENKIVIADIGHYESEQFTKELFYNLLIKKFPKFAVHFSNINTNPINYL